jgi:cation diffusion facilitator CzcD-associated flavoprotein CzcO
MERVDVAIVGAGIAGLGLGARLRAAGRDSFVILERDDAPGGTWRENTYPGAACDIPSHLYSYSFAANPRWSRRYSPQREILRYLEGFAEAHGLTPHVRTGREVTNARFDGQTRTWKVETATGETFEARALVPACGQLSMPQIPAFTGLEDFRGPSWHSARWDHSVDLAGKRVAVIGSGASAIQVVPEVAKIARELRVFQRTPPWIIPRHDRRYTRLERAAFERWPALRRAHRWFMYWSRESVVLALRPGTAAARALTGLSRWHLERQVSDPALRAALTPSYPIGCKRVLVSDDYYPALQRPGVELVTAGMDRFVEEGIRTTDGRLHELDAVVFATGFDSQALVAPMRVEGPDGRTLDDIWAGGPRAHRGVTVAGMPNLFLLYGPNTNLGHNSMVFMIECQFGYVMQAIDEVLRDDRRTLTVREEVMERFDASLQDELRHSVWSAGCNNWYKDDSGRIVNNWAGPAIAYWWATRRLDLDEYAVA